MDELWEVDDIGLNCSGTGAREFWSDQYGTTNLFCPGSQGIFFTDGRIRSFIP
jgi:hypothetical protein